MATVTNSIAEVSFFSPSGSGVSQGVTVQIVGDPLLYTTAIRTWRMGLYSDTTGWPTCGTYHEGRLWLMGVLANRLDGGRSNGKLFSFAPTEPSGTVTDSNAISYKFNSPDANKLLWGEPDQLGIVIGTNKGEWLVQASALNSPLTPTSIQAHRMMKHKCANIEPRRTGLTLAVVQAYKRSLLEFFHDTYSGKFSAKNLALTGKHLTKTGIAEIAYQQELTPIIWARRVDGLLVGCTYKRETLVSSQPPDYAGWHQQPLGTGRDVESICMAAINDGSLDALLMVTNDSVSGIRHIELMNPVFEEDDDLEDGWLLDDAITPTTVNISTTFDIYGLWPHEGKTVTVWAGGLDCGDLVVSGGKVSVTFGDGASGGTGGGLFTAAFASSFTGGIPVVVGFPYTVRGQIVRPAKSDESGARNGPAVGKKRRLEGYALQTAASIVNSVKFGTTFVAARQRPVKYRTEGGTPYGLLELFSGVHYDTLENTYDYDGMITWEQTRPYPLIVTIVSGFIATSDK